VVDPLERVLKIHVVVVEEEWLVFFGWVGSNRTFSYRYDKYILRIRIYISTNKVFFICIVYDICNVLFKSAL